MLLGNSSRPVNAGVRLLLVRTAEGYYAQQSWLKGGLSDEKALFSSCDSVKLGFAS
jgi:hypothetical protein